MTFMLKAAAAVLGLAALLGPAPGWAGDEEDFPGWFATASALANHPYVAESNKYDAIVADLSRLADDGNIAAGIYLEYICRMPPEGEGENADHRSGSFMRKNMFKPNAESAKWGRLSREAGVPGRLEVLAEKNPDAEFLLSVIYSYGLAEEQMKPVDGARLLRQSAERGSVQGAYSLAFQSRLALMLPRLPEAEIFKWMLKAAEGGHAEAQSEVGSGYRHGRGVGKDPDKAREWYLKAAAQGHTGSMSRLASMCEQEGQVEAALEWLQKAVDAGDKFSAWRLGNMYKKGQGVEKDLDKAISVYSQSFAAGDLSSASELADIYEELGNTALAIEWHRQSAEAGNPMSALRLAEIYEKGLGVEADQAQADHWRQKSLIRQP